jgi:hypothetical protein
MAVFQDLFDLLLAIYLLQNQMDISEFAEFKHYLYYDRKH